MTAEANRIESIDDELNTTAPQSKPDVWKMPEPVFRRTSGKLPKAFADKATEVIESDGDVQAHSSPEMTPPAIASPDPKPKSPILKLVLVALALGAMIAFIVVLLTVVYFFFLR
jgi:hypothetical protein